MSRYNTRLNGVCILQQSHVAVPASLVVYWRGKEVLLTKGHLNDIHMVLF